MESDLLTMKECSVLVNRPINTIQNWIRCGKFSWSGEYSKNLKTGSMRKLYWREDLLRTAAEMDASFQSRCNRLSNRGEPTQEELDALIAERSEHLPKWWNKEASKCRDGSHLPDLSPQLLRLIHCRRYRCTVHAGNNRKNLAL